VVAALTHTHTPPATTLQHTSDFKRPSMRRSVRLAANLGLGQEVCELLQGGWVGGGGGRLVRGGGRGEGGQVGA
jgi:hypothetical protein